MGEAPVLARIPVEPPYPDAISGGGPTAGLASNPMTRGGLAVRGLDPSVVRDVARVKGCSSADLHGSSLHALRTR
jgi:hypothetical protein